MRRQRQIFVFVRVLVVWCSLSFAQVTFANPLPSSAPAPPTTATEYIQSLNQNSKVMDLQLKYYSEQLQDANQRLQELEAALSKERKTYAPQIAATVARLRFLQQQSFSSQGWHVLLNSENLNEFFDRRDRLRQLYQADRERLETLQVRAIEIQRQKSAIETKQTEIERFTQQIRTQKQDLAAQLKLQQQILARGSTQDQIKAAQTQLSRDAASIEQLLQQRKLSSEVLAVTGTGQLIAPHAGEVTSLFGPRRHPVLGGKRLHTGVDFKGSYGSPVKAADSGVVIFANWYGGYGKTVAIAHGDDLTTLYCHLNAITVVEGQPIRRGELIGEVGSTGLSTGPHLHFELRQQGKAIDPAPYLVVRGPVPDNN
ncbi:MAG: peptidoglycan DD-metalloendopeptidase family protein [Spirulina sp. SIO3F2]|nr:peptidoglycan DD-metalloendopeptidase family protein [Spirulina sp. SIO3F2]